jgi:hypothetical protein
MAKDMIIEKSISIDRPATEVFAYLKQTKNQDQFSVWNMKDPSMQKTFSGIDGNKGFVYAWDSKDKNVGAGSQEIINILDGTRIDYKIEFLRPMKNTGTSSFVVDKIDENNSSVSWIFQSPVKFPMTLFAPFLKNMLGKQLGQSLQNLKGVLERE